MTSSPAKGTIEKRKWAVGDTAPYISTRSSGDRAFGSGPKGRRFDSCRVQQAGIIRTRYPSVMDLEFWFIFERKKARSFDLAFLLCLRFLFICIIFRLRERIVHKYAVLPKKIFLFSGLREISSLWKQDRKYICKVHILLY